MSPPCVGVAATTDGWASDVMVLPDPLPCPAFAPCPLRHFSATMRALTSRSVSPPDGISLLHVTSPADHSVPNHPMPPCHRFYRPCSFSVTGLQYAAPAHAVLARTYQGSRGCAPHCSGLRAALEGSSQHLAETGSLYYGLVVRLLLLSTPPRGDAVAVDYTLSMFEWSGLPPLRRSALTGARVRSLETALLPRRVRAGGIMTARPKRERPHSLFASRPPFTPGSG